MLVIFRLKNVIIRQNLEKHQNNILIQSGILLNLLQADSIKCCSDKLSCDFSHFHPMGYVLNQTAQLSL